MPIKVQSYECKFNCKKILRSHSGMVYHESKCLLDPEKKACITCGSNFDDLYTVYDPNHGGDPGSSDYEVPTRTCLVFDTDLFEYKNLKHHCNSWSEKVSDE